MDAVLSKLYEMQSSVETMTSKSYLLPITESNSRLNGLKRVHKATLCLWRLHGEIIRLEDLLLETGKFVNEGLVSKAEISEGVEKQIRGIKRVMAQISRMLYQKGLYFPW